MAGQTGSEMVGRVEDLIFYEREGEFLIRTLPEQTTATKKAAKLFGKASSRAKSLRGLLLPLLPDPRDKEMQNRLCTAMFRYLKVESELSPVLPENNPLAGFRFVSTSDLDTCLKFPLVFSRQSDGDLLLEIPAIRPTDDIAAPPGTSRVELKLVAVSFSMESDQSSAGEPVLVEIAYDNILLPAKNVVINTGSDEDTTIFVVAAVSYFDGNRCIRQPGFEPVEILR